jgi:O-antigen/teichoic acid export membrane protein
MATLASLLLTASLMIFCFSKDLLAGGLNLNPQKLKIARRYKDFPVFSAPASLLDGLGLALPVFFLAKYYPLDVVGYYALITRVAMAPLNFLSQSVSQLNMKKISYILSNGQDPFLYTLKVFILLFSIALVPMVILFIWGEPIFSIFFGPKWQETGGLIAILLPSITIKFIASTLSGAMISTGHLRLVAFWQIFSIVVTSAMFLFVGSDASTREIFLYITFTDFFIYSIYMIFIMYSVKTPKVIN